MMYDLPTSLEICGTEYTIRSDYRAVLDICTALSDPDLSEQDKGLALLDIFYPDFTNMPAEHYNEAVKQCFWFINCGEDAEERQEKKTPKLMDWNQDFKYIVPPINRVTGQEIRAIPYMHWWSFISAYYEIGDCLFAQIIRIRDKKAKGKKLDKSDREFYQKNRHIVDLKTTYSEQENQLLNEWTKV